MSECAGDLEIFIIQDVVGSITCFGGIDDQRTVRLVFGDLECWD